MEIENPLSDSGGEMQESSPSRDLTDNQYDFVIDLNSDSTHAKVIRMVGDDRRVLELGPASGYMSAVLSKRGCTIVGIEIDTDMAAQAERFCERLIVGDLDVLDIEAELGDDRFDVIVAADVLEHLRDPLKTLRTLRDFLKPEGYFVVSVPNVAHASVRLALLDGRFSYQDLGLLDRTHLRFFTHESIAQLFDEAELAVVEVHRQEAGIDTTEITVDIDAVPAGIIKELEQDPDARTYQFVLKAIPLHAPGMRELQSRIREQALACDRAERELALANDQAERELALATDRAERELMPRIRELEQALAEISAREGQLRVALIDAHDQLLSRDEQIDEFRLENKELENARGELERIRDELKGVRGELAQLLDRREADTAELAMRDAEVQKLKVRLDRILNSPPARIYTKLGRLPLLRGIVRRRTAGYQRALSDAEHKGS
jgi:2-polyprenyl-3-methyl-5-hydroxy-6-metoxy-1,4-benzoquinol methylase